MDGGSTSNQLSVLPAAWPSMLQLHVTDQAIPRVCLGVCWELVSAWFTDLLPTLSTGGWVGAEAPDAARP
jgi:hypothetical protein